MHDTGELSNSIEHMFTAHGLFIPDQAMLSDPASFIGYLATQVRVWHECLYCGTTRTSTLAIQSHMRDSSHCMLNFEREPELLEFWERRANTESSTSNMVRSGTAFGQTVGLKSSHQGRLRARNARLVLQAGPQLYEASTHQSCHQLARGDAMGLQNVSPQLRQALVLAEKRSQKDEAMANRAKEWTYARKANKQKHDQAHGPLSWAKGGAHNLLPR